MAQQGSGAGGGPYRVMVVDDSAVVRGLTTRFIEEDPEMEVVASVGNGQRALDNLERAQPEVVVLDIEMPVMDGLTALPKLLAQKPGLKVVMSSTLTKGNADVTMRALRDGAAEYITKPSNKGLTGQSDFQTELRTKVKALGAAARRGAGGAAVGLRTPASAPGTATTSRAPSGGSSAASPSPTPTARSASQTHASQTHAGQAHGAQTHAGQTHGGTMPRPPAGGGEITLRKMPTTNPEVLAIGSSTGGPQALFEVLGKLGAIKQPILVTQHMPATFTALLADHIARQSALPCSEAKDGEKLANGHIYIAPGGRHLVVARDSGGVRLHLSDAEPENFCRPSTDPMLRSLVDAFGGRMLVAILTGMGHDGLHGCERVVEAGGHVIAQDEASSVVWGMPGAVAKAGLCSAVLPLTEIAPQLRKLTMRSAA